MPRQTNYTALNVDKCFCSLLLYCNMTIHNYKMPLNRTIGLIIKIIKNIIKIKYNKNINIIIIKHNKHNKKIIVLVFGQIPD